MNRKKDFNSDFKWGAATSSFQIEGNVDVDGKLESIWDRFTDNPNAIRDRDHAKVACDHYNRWETDLDLLQQLGVNSYRFSTSWPRVVKGNLKDINSKGLDFYDKMVDGLLKRGIEPFLTLNHWDVPQAFHDRGGWLKRDASQIFLDYTEIVSNKLGDRVKNWITHNEPWVIAHLGYNEGKHAPGHKCLYETLKVSHHLLLSHGEAVPIIKSNSNNSKVGITLNLTPAYPASSSEADKRSAELFDQFFNTWYLNPLYGKDYPKEIIESWKNQGELKNDLDFVKEGDIDTISYPTDFLGVNYYSRAINRCSITEEDKNLPVEIIAGEKTKFDWEVFPQGLKDLLIRINRDYSPPSLFITENGASYDYDIEKNDHIDDVKRVEYIRSHIDACRQAISEGVPLDGYFCWSLMDNFEWAEGYYHKFGLIHVDNKTQKRIPKNSYKWYREFLSN